MADPGDDPRPGPGGRSCDSGTERAGPPSSPRGTTPRVRCGGGSGGPACETAFLVTRVPRSCPRAPPSSPPHRRWRHCQAVGGRGRGVRGSACHTPPTLGILPNANVAYGVRRARRVRPHGPPCLLPHVAAAHRATGHDGGSTPGVLPGARHGHLGAALRGGVGSRRPGRPHRGARSSPDGSVTKTCTGSGRGGGGGDPRRARQGVPPPDTPGTVLAVGSSAPTTWKVVTDGPRRAPGPPAAPHRLAGVARHRRRSPPGAVVLRRDDAPGPGPTRTPRGGAAVTGVVHRRRGLGRNEPRGARRRPGCRAGAPPALDAGEVAGRDRGRQRPRSQSTPRQAAWRHRCDAGSRSDEVDRTVAASSAVHAAGPRPGSARGRSRVANTTRPVGRKLAPRHRQAPSSPPRDEEPSTSIHRTALHVGPPLRRPAPDRSVPASRVDMGVTPRSAPTMGTQLPCNRRCPRHRGADAPTPAAPKGAALATCSLIR